ncbi:MAG: hypothetical protein JWM11_3526 [Planctomycetaceae bacterium]|nr:hypothetical protein [Planctomycetaceae bacterium]
MWVLGIGLQSHQIDDIDHSDFQVWKRISQNGYCRQCLQGGNVATAGHHDIRTPSVIIAGPLPDTDACGAVLDRLVHRQPLRGGMLSGDYDIDVVATAQAVVHD